MIPKKIANERRNVKFAVLKGKAISFSISMFDGE